MPDYLIYILVMAGVTYLIRMLPMALVKGRIKSRFIRSVIHYVPYAVLSAMTIPAIFYSTPALVLSIAGLAVGVIVAILEKPLLTVALSSCAAVLIGEIILLLF